MIRSIGGKTPQIHPSAFISEAAYVVGDVVIGEGTNVWPGAVIRGDYGRIIIGKHCSIQDNCVIHTDDYLEFGDHVLMTHGAVVHGGKIGSNVMIGVNAVCLEDCDVGNYVLIGAGAIVTGTAIPDESLVIGVPGRIRELPAVHRERLENPTARYQENAKRFIAAGLGLQIPATETG